MIAAYLPPIADCWDCADFFLVPLLWIRARYAAALSPALLAEIDRTILGYRYWLDEPGNDVQWYFSENHALLFHTAAYLAGHLLPDRRFVRSGRTGAEQSATGRDRVRAWLDHFERWEMAEFNSAPYFPIDLKGLTALFALAPDPDIRDRAARGIARLLEIVANSAHHGILTAAQGRSYEHSLRAGRLARTLRHRPPPLGPRQLSAPASTPCPSSRSACATTASPCPTSPPAPSGRATARRNGASARARTASPPSTTTRPAPMPWAPPPATAGANGATRRR